MGQMTVSHLPHHKAGDTGLGLYMSRLLIAEAGGTVTLQETSSNGSEFRIVLPEESSS